MITIFYKKRFFIPTLLVIGFLFSLMMGCKKSGDVKPPIEVPFVRLIEGESLQSNIFGQAVKYSVLLPADYKTSGLSYPVVYLLHGFGDNYTSWSKGGNIRFFADNTADMIPMIYVMPDGYNSYYVNNFNGANRYMDMFTKELVPEIDKIYRTKKEASQRAVMGYSMGGYGALVLPAKNPDIFTVSVPLSMSFRTDAQYIAESQGSFNSQWASIYGGLGLAGTSRLTNYFKQYSPFHFFNQTDLSSFSKLKLLLQCGDDEESLSVTSGALHNLLRDKNIPHEYRSGNGGHSWDYWYKAIPEGLQYITKSFQGSSYPAEPQPVSIGAEITPDKYKIENLASSTIQLGIFTPSTYATSTALFPVIFYINDGAGAQRKENAIKTISLLNNQMEAGRIPKSVIVEIPNTSAVITVDDLTAIVDQIKTNYRIVANREGRILIGSGNAGNNVWTIASGAKQLVSSCFLFDATLPDNATAEGSVFYYIDATDNTSSYKGNFDLYVDARVKEADHEYRIRQGTPSFQSFINGLNGAATYLSRQLNRK